ncbi:MAG: DUF2844 domain-containing protein [Steroidobacteraceae bacterium]
MMGILAVIVAAPARAALGDQVASIENDRAKMKATAAVAAKPLYTVHELRLPYGTVVREYVSSAGLVFAVAWEGPHQPDFKQLLGSYFESYRHAPRSSSLSRSHATVEQGNLVMHMAGHMRAFFGQAYDPHLLPAGVSVDEIQ